MTNERSTRHGISRWETKFREMEQANLRSFMIESENQEPVVCSRFGCGKLLSLQEKLYGSTCLRHTGKGKTIGTGKCFTNRMRLSVTKSVYKGFAANAGSCYNLDILFFQCQ